MSDERDKLYRPIFDDGKHLARDKNGFNLGSTLNNSNNKLSGQARWVEVDPASLRPGTSLGEEIFINMAVKATEIGVSYFVSWAAPRIVDFWHETVMPAAKKQFYNLAGKASNDSVNAAEEMNSTVSVLDEVAEERIDEIINESEQKWAAYHNSPEYQKRKEEVNRGLEERRAYFESPEFQKKCDVMMKRAEECMAYLESPEYQKKYDAMMKRAQERMAYLESPEYQKKYDAMMKRAEERMAYYESPEYQKKYDAMMKRAEERMAYYESPEYLKKDEERRRRTEERMEQLRKEKDLQSEETQIVVKHSDVAENETRESEDRRFDQGTKRPMVSEEYMMHVANIKGLAILLAHEIKAISDAYEVEQMPPDRRIEARAAVEQLTSKVFMDGVSYLLMDENRALLEQSTVDILQAFNNRCFLIYGEPVPIELLTAEDGEHDK